MQASSIRLALAISISLAACNKHTETCEKYVAISMKCDKSNLEGSEKAQLKSMLIGICQSAHAEDYSGATAADKKIMVEMYAHVKAAAACESKATTCEEYERCEASLKDK